MKLLIVLMVISLGGCGWFHGRKPPLPLNAVLVVSGAPPGSQLFVDGVMVGGPREAGAQSAVVRVAPGTHVVEVKVSDAVVYHEESDVDAGQRRAITVLSGVNRY